MIFLPRIPFHSVFIFFSSLFFCRFCFIVRVLVIHLGRLFFSLKFVFLCCNKIIIKHHDEKKISPNHLIRVRYLLFFFLDKKWFIFTDFFHVFFSSEYSFLPFFWSSSSYLIYNMCWACGHVCVVCVYL